MAGSLGAFGESCAVWDWIAVTGSTRAHYNREMLALGNAWQDFVEAHGCV